MARHNHTSQYAALRHATPHDHTLQNQVACWSTGRLHCTGGTAGTAGTAMRCRTAAVQQYSGTVQRDEGAAYLALVLAGPKCNLPREWNPPRGRGEDHRRHAPRAERNERSQQQVSKAQKRAQQAQQRAQRRPAASAVRERVMWHVRAGQERYCRDPQRSE